MPFLWIREKSLWSIEDVKLSMSSDEMSLAAVRMAGNPEVILGSVLPPTGVKLPFQDAPQIFDGIQIWRIGWPLHNFPMPRKNTLQIFGGKPCSMRRDIIMHEYYLFPESQILLLVPGYEVFLNEVNVEFGSHFHSICNSKWSYQLVSNDCRPKHHTTTSLLTPDPVGTWTILAKPSSPLSIGSIKGRLTLVGEQNCLKIDFHVISCPLHSLFLVDIIQWWVNLWFSTFCNIPQDTASS